MASKDLKNNVSVATTLSPAARTANANGVGVDLQGFESALVVMHTGTITDGNHTIQVEESDDNVAFTAVADADLQGVEPVIAAANDDTVYEIGYLGAKRYIRVTVAVAGATTGGVYGAAVVRGHSRRNPA